MKTCMGLAAIILAGSMFIGCDKKETVDTTTTPAVTTATNAMQTAGDTVKTDAQKAADAAKTDADKAVGKLDDAASKVKLPGN